MSRQYGDGSGYGSGTGSGTGSGDGSGTGSGDGTGYGFGTGYGYGDGSIEVPEGNPILGWHFVPEDRRLRCSHRGNRPRVAEGLVLSCDPDRLNMCSYGLHASIDRDDARTYCDGIATRVAVWGRVLVGEDKMCAQYRKVIEVHD